MPDGEFRAEQRLWQGTVAAATAPVEAPARYPRQLVFPALVLAGVAVIMLVSTPAPHRASAPVERGSPSRSKVPLQPPALHVFHALPGGGSEPVTERIRAGDGLLMAYSNPGTDARWLMVFAVDDGCHVHWFYPAYQRAGENPTAIAIGVRENGVELGEEIRHDFRSRQLCLHSLFLVHPMNVLEVEEIVRRACEEPQWTSSVCNHLPVAASHQEYRTLEVIP